MTVNSTDQSKLPEQKVGVVIPTYCRLEYLREAIASLLNQTHTNIHVLIVDDASPDNTAAFLESIDDPRLTSIINEQNMGLSGSINKGIRLLPADILWCTVLCDDDILAPDYLENTLQVIKEQAVRSVIYGRIRFIDAKGSTIRDVPPLPKEETALEYLQARADSVRDTYLSGTVFSRTMFEIIGGYPQFTTGMAADEAFLFALALQDRLVYASEARVLIRVHDDAESQDVWGIPGHIKAVRDYAAYCNHLSGESFPVNRQIAVELAPLLHRRVRVLNSLLWLRGERHIRKYAKKSERSINEIKHLYSMARNSEWIFPKRIRIDGWCAKLTGLSPEGFGLYRYFWEKVLGIKPGK